MVPRSQHYNSSVERRWTNADGEKVFLWISLGSIITIILFTILLGTLNLYLGKPIAKVREFEDEKAVRDTRADTLTRELEDLRTQLARETEEREAAVKAKEAAERGFNTQTELVQQQNDRIRELNRERDDRAEEVRQRVIELVESRLFATERATETTNLRNNLQGAEAEKTRLERECDRLRMQLNFANEQVARLRQRCNVDED